MSYDIAADKESPGGLRLVEWLRGYAVLGQIAEDRSHSGADANNIVFTIPVAELIEILDRCGLKNGRAERFISAATFAKSSRDLFDCPLIKLADGLLLIFGPSLISSNPARIILSQISNRGEPLARKGKAFETDILRFIKKQGLTAGSFKKKYDGEEYEYDVVVVWGDYVFVLECKNHSLSNHHPVQAYYFELELASSANQVKRLADNLIRHPEILLDEFGVEIVDKKIIACVVNSLPYALPGQVNGVYFTDASGLKRFFQDRYFHMNTQHEISGELRLLHRSATHSLWDGDKPTPDDLIRQLESPFQLKLMLAHTRLGTKIFPIKPYHAVCVHQFMRAEMSIDSYADVVGVSAQAVRADQAAVRRQVQKLRNKMKKRKQIRSRS